jgi:CHAT domain-containing protein
MERAKARAFLEGLGEAKIDIKGNLPPYLALRENHLTNEISSILIDLSREKLSGGEKRTFIERLGGAEDEYMRLLSEMRLVAPDVANLVSPDILTLSDLQNSFLDDDTGLVEYLLGESKSYIFYISKKIAKVTEIESRGSLERSLRGYIKAIMNPASGEFPGHLAGERIAKEILLPISDQIDERIKRLIVIPDGILNYLPFETLRIPKTRGQGLEYLIERVEVSYAPSASSLAYLSKKKPGPRARCLLAIGDPALLRRPRGKKSDGGAGTGFLYEIGQGQGLDFGPLPFSRKEVLGIAKQFPDRSSRVFLGREAREDILKGMPLDEYQILHFACHGVIDEDVPFRSALLLSNQGAPNDDGFLQAREIYTLKMNADLVVLSACRTGKGKLEKGEGVLGLARVFFYAGSKSVISTLWAIEDRSTAEFMNEFYGFLVKGCGKAEALRLAKIGMLTKSYKHPFYWASFILNGDYGPIFPRLVQ